MAKRKGMDDIVEIDGKQYKVKVQHRKNSDGIDEPFEVYEEVDKKSYATGGKMGFGGTMTQQDGEVVQFFINDIPYYIRKHGTGHFFYMGTDSKVVGSQYARLSHIEQPEVTGREFSEDLQKWVKGESSAAIKGKKYKDNSGYYKGSDKVEQKLEQKVEQEKQPTHRIKTNVYYVNNYESDGFQQEAVPEYEISDVEDMLESDEGNHEYIDEGTEGWFDGEMFETVEGSNTRVEPKYVEHILGDGGKMQHGGKIDFKVGSTLYHKDFENGKEPLKIVELYNENKLYNTVDNVSGVSVKAKNGNNYSLYFDTETMRRQNRPTGSESSSYKKIIDIVDYAKGGMLIVTPDEKFVYEYNEEKKVPLKKGMNLTRYVRDYNESSANMSIKNMAKKGLKAKWIEVPYDFATKQTYANGGEIGKTLSEIGDVDEIYVQGRYPNGDEFHENQSTNDADFVIKDWLKDNRGLDSYIMYARMNDGEEIEIQEFKNGGYYAKGGMFEHGLRMGDKITGYGLGDGTIEVEHPSGTALVDLNEGKRHERKESGGRISMINKRRAKASLRQIKSGKRDDGMGEFDAILYGVDSNGEQHVITSENQLEKYTKFGLGYKMEHGGKTHSTKHVYIPMSTYRGDMLEIGSAYTTLDDAKDWIRKKEQEVTTIDSKGKRGKRLSSSIEAMLKEPKEQVYSMEQIDEKALHFSYPMQGNYAYIIIETDLKKMMEQGGGVSMGEMKESLRDLSTTEKLQRIGSGAKKLFDMGTAKAKDTAYKLKKQSAIQVITDTALEVDSDKELNTLYKSAKIVKNKYEDGGTITNYFSKMLPEHVEERMDGLTNQLSLKVLKKSASKIMNELQDEGFDDEDIYLYMYKIMSKIRLKAYLGKLIKAGVAMKQAQNMAKSLQPPPAPMQQQYPVQQQPMNVAPAQPRRRYGKELFNKVKSGVKKGLSKEVNMETGGNVDEDSVRYVFVQQFDYPIAKFMTDKEGLTHVRDFEEDTETAILIYNTPDNMEWLEREFPARNIRYKLSEPRSGKSMFDFDMETGGKVNKKKGEIKIEELKKLSQKYPKNDVRRKKIEKEIYDIQFLLDYSLPGSQGYKQVMENGGKVIKNIKLKPFLFEVTQKEEPKIYGHLKFGDETFKGFFEYTEKSGLGWSFKNKMNEEFETEMVDDYEDEWFEFTMKIISCIEQEEYAKGGKLKDMSKKDLLSEFHFATNEEDKDKIRKVLNKKYGPEYYTGYDADYDLRQYRKGLNDFNVDSKTGLHKKGKPKVERKATGVRRRRLKNELIDLNEDLEYAVDELTQEFTDMNIEAGQKGEDWTDADANRYGAEMNKLEDKIAKIKARISKVESML